MGYKRLPDIAKAAAEDVLRPTIALKVPFKDAISVIKNIEAGKREPGRVVLRM